MTDALLDYAAQRLWVTWKNEIRGNRATKVPYSPTINGRASSTDPSTWATRAIVERAVEREAYDGIGIVLAGLDEGRHLGGIDLDSCIDDEGNVAPWAREIIELLNSYTERSPSGLGLKVFFTHDERLTLAEGVRWRSVARRPSPDGGKEPGIEFYLRARYFTVTDDAFEQYDTIRAVDLDTLRRVQRLMDAFDLKTEAPPHHPRHHDDDEQRIIDAIGRMPNRDLHWEEWNTQGMAIYAATGGSAQGYAAFLGWSAKSAKYDQRGCDERWQHWHTSPPDRLTAGTIFHRAGRETSPQAKSNGAAIENAADVENANDKAAADQPGDGGGRGPKQADMLIALADEAELFHTPDGTGFANLKVNGHRETWPIRRKDFRRWLVRRFFKETGGAPNSEALQSALNLIEAKAQFDGQECEVFTRVGEHGGKLYLDLCDDKWRAVEIDADGWRIVDEPPLRFRRAAGMKPLPEPQRGGSIKQLRSSLNIASENDFVLAVAWVLAGLRNRGPYPVLALAGEQGTGKSLLVAILRSLVDPNVAPLRSLPREERDLFIAATNGHVLAFDNVSGLPAWLSDALCRVATGAAFTARQLYSDQDEVLFAACRPIVLNGIEDIVSRSDLADRTLFLTLPLIAEENRRTEAELWAAFETERPLILGALLDAVAEGVKRLPETQLERLPRMADFALWATACETALWSKGAFMKAYAENIGGAVDAVIDADPIADAVRTLMTAKKEQEGAEEPKWEGTASALLSTLADVAGERTAKSKSWPESSRALSGRLRRAATGLRKIGVKIGFKRKGQAGTRTISITGTPKSPAPDGVGNFASVPSAPSAAMPKSKPANDLAAQNTLTQPPALTQTPLAQNFASAQKPFENRHADATDGTDAKSSAPSSPRVERRI